MKVRQIASQLLVWCVCFVAANAVVGRVSRTSIPQQMLRASAQAPLETRVICMGSSVMQDGFDAAAYSAVAAPALQHAINIGMRSSTPAEHLMLLRTALRSGLKPAVVVYGFFGNELIRPIAFDWSTLSANRSMVFNVDPALATDVMHDASRVDRVFYTLTRPFPLVFARAQLWGRVERARRTLSAVGLPPIPENQFGRAGDMFAFVRDLDDKSLIREWSTGDRPLSTCVLASIRASQAAGARCVFVEMPTRSDRRAAMVIDQERQAFTVALTNAVQKAGGVLLHSLDWVPDDRLFTDQIHLNDAGARVFSERLASVLSAALNRQLPLH